MYLAERGVHGFVPGVDADGGHLVRVGTVVERDGRKTPITITYSRPVDRFDWLLSHLLLDRPYREAPFALLADESVDWTPRLTTATHLLTFLHIAGEDELVQQLIGRFDPLVDAVPASTLSRSFWYTFRAIHDMRCARQEEASARFQKAEDLAAAEGLVQAEYVALQFRTYADTVFRRIEDAQARLKGTASAAR